MNSPMGSFSTYSKYNLCMILFTSLVLAFGQVKRVEAFGTFGFDFHHRYSDTLRDFLDFDGLPEKGTLEYYAAMGHRDRFIKGRHLAEKGGSASPSTHLTFLGGNQTFRISTLGFLHYAFVTVGTPALPFLVALDTGSDLFWLPCDCNSCARNMTLSGKPVELNIYSPSTSSSSMTVPCNSTKCGRRRRCSVSRNACAYQAVYLSANTSSSGILVEDVLHLATDDSQEKPVDASITLGCGIVQTGDFLSAAAPNGLFGLGLDNVSVPSILASNGLAANSFSMCFGSKGIGKIVFGDKGSADQKVTPLNLEQSHPSYNISITKLVVGNKVSNIEFTAIFDSGTSFTYLNDPIYSAIAENFDSYVKEPRYQTDSDFIFEYCYELSSTQTSFDVPFLNLTMKGGEQFYVEDPIVTFSLRNGGYAYCLAIVKSEDIDIIGQNFMTGYRMVFDREEMVLGWKKSDCYEFKNSSSTLPVNKPKMTEAPSPSMMNPEAVPSNRTKSPDSSVQPPLSRQRPLVQGSHATSLNYTLLMVILSLCHYLVILSS